MEAAGIEPVNKAIENPKQDALLPTIALILLRFVIPPRPTLFPGVPPQTTLLNTPPILVLRRSQERWSPIRAINLPLTAPPRRSRASGTSANGMILSIGMEIFPSENRRPSVVIASSRSSAVRTLCKAPVTEMPCVRILKGSTVGKAEPPAKPIRI
ncbi:Hypothetical protein AA314_02023 [Archangium gephyra]|uniref:Uncharacterized protein n=1 Tax=Archangium gephyra TaxID=48 RepID=A0AAC8Q3V7_9BACT|nr:Hypothetical protein AA314_02023 [Archangium gephyra]